MESSGRNTGVATHTFADGGSVSDPWASEGASQTESGITTKGRAFHVRRGVKMASKRLQRAVRNFAGSSKQPGSHSHADDVLNEDGSGFSRRQGSSRHSHSERRRSSHSYVDEEAMIQQAIAASLAEANSSAADDERLRLALELSKAEAVNHHDSSDDESADEEEGNLLGFDTTATQQVHGIAPLHGTQSYQQAMQHAPPQPPQGGLSAQQQSFQNASAQQQPFAVAQQQVFPSAGTQQPFGAMHQQQQAVPLPGTQQQLATPGSGTQQQRGIPLPGMHQQQQATPGSGGQQYPPQLHGLGHIQPQAPSQHQPSSQPNQIQVPSLPGNNQPQGFPAATPTLQQAPHQPPAQAPMQQHQYDVANPFETQ